MRYIFVFLKIVCIKYTIENQNIVEHNFLLEKSLVRKHFILGYLIERNELLLKFIKLLYTLYQRSLLLAITHIFVLLEFL